MTENTNNKIEFTPARRQAINRAVETYGAMIERFFHNSLRKHDIAQDLSQIFWVQVYSTFREQDFFEVGFLINKARQILSNYLRYSGVRAFVEFDSESPEMLSAVASDSYLDDVQRENIFWEERMPHADLTETEKKIVWQHTQHKVPFTELAEDLKMPVSTVQDWYHRTLKKLADAKNKERNG